MNKFAKLFQTEEYGQILVVLDSDRETGNPCVSFKFMPEGFGVCENLAGYEDGSDLSWDRAENFFNSVDEDKAVSFIEPTIDSISEMGMQ